MSRHTAGAWRAVTQVRGGLVGFVVGTSGPEGPIVVCEIFPKPYLVAINAANADLIAAAPEMLDVLERVKASLGDRLLAKGPLSVAYAHGVMAEINAAVEKARGGR